MTEKTLPLATFMESKVMGMTPGWTRRFKIKPIREPSESIGTLNDQVVVRYHAEFGCRLVLPKGAEIEGRKRAARILLREMYKGLDEELLDLREYAWEQGLDDISDRVSRLLTLIEGGSVPVEIPPSRYQI
jgi:hypothetical protein